MSLGSDQNEESDCSIIIDTEQVKAAKTNEKGMMDYLTDASIS